jgi:hypothetical protein
MIHFSEKTRQLPDTGITLPFMPANILPYLLGQNETLTHDLSMPTTTAACTYDSTCCTLSNTTAATTINHYDTGNSAINTGKNPAIYNYDSTRHSDYSVKLLVKQWLSEDPIGEQGGINLYGYCQNDPVNLRDELGLKVTVLEIGKVTSHEFVALKNQLETYKEDIRKVKGVVRSLSEEKFQAASVKWNGIRFKGTRQEFLSLPGPRVTSRQSTFQKCPAVPP